VTDVIEPIPSVVAVISSTFRSNLGGGVLAAQLSLPQPMSDEGSGEVEGESRPLKDRVGTMG